MTGRRKINLLMDMLKDGIGLSRACEYLKIDRGLNRISQELRNEIFALQSTQSIYHSDNGVWFEDIYSEAAKKRLQIY